MSSDHSKTIVSNTYDKKTLCTNFSDYVSFVKKVTKVQKKLQSPAHHAINLISWAAHCQNAHKCASIYTLLCKNMHTVVHEYANCTKWRAYLLQQCPFLKPNPDLVLLWLSLSLTPISEQTCPFTLPSPGELLLKSKIANLTRIPHPVVFWKCSVQSSSSSKVRPSQESQPQTPSSQIPPIPLLQNKPSSSFPSPSIYRKRRRNPTFVNSVVIVE